jgi:toxin ParE1/3/4
MARKVIWSDEAIADLAAIVRYVAGDNPTAAEKLGRTIFDRTRVLAEYAHLGRVVPEAGNTNVREIIVEPYRVIYELSSNNDTIDVLRVWHAARGEPEL